MSNVLHDDLERQLLEFDKTWNLGRIPAIEDFLLPEHENDPKSRYCLLVELVMIDQEYRWRQDTCGAFETTVCDRGRRTTTTLPIKPSLADYLKAYPVLGRMELLPARLIANEYRVRSLCGDRPRAVEYRRRFPHAAEQLVSALQSIDQQLAESEQAERIRIRCPHCHGPIEFTGTDLSDVNCPKCGSKFSLLGDPAASDDLAQRQLGQFELLEKVGAGSFGTVWKARDHELDRIVAIKIPRRGILSTDEAGEFLREARAAAQLRHPNIVAVHEVGREANALFIASDFVEGVTLEELLTDRRLNIREAMELCARIAEALDHAHQAGVVHRDLKPANIMITLSSTDGDGDGEKESDLEPHIMDFGLARRDADEITMTADGKVLGTPAYMSPEQAKGEAHLADAHSDIFSFGVLLFELLTGEKPFRGDFRMLLQQVVHDAPPSPRRLNANVSKDLETICLKCLEKEPRQRYQSSLELGRELRRCLRGAPIEARPVSHVARIWRWSKRNPVVTGLTVGLAITLLAGLAGVSTQWFRAEREAEDNRRLLYLSDMRVAQQTWEANDVAGCLERLRRHVPQSEQSDLRCFEWYHLWRLCEPSLAARTFQLDTAVGSVAISPDGKTLAAAGVGTLKLWDLQTHNELASVEPFHESLVAGLAFCGSGGTIATGSLDGTLKLWKPAVNNQPIVLRKGGWFLGVAYSPETNLLATNGSDDDLLLWDVESRSLVGAPLPAPEGIRCLTFSADGKSIATAGWDTTVRLRDVTTNGQPPALLQGHTEPVEAVAFSPDGALLASGGRDNRIILWNVETRRKIANLEGHTSFVWRVAFSPGGDTLASASSDGTIKLWDVKSPDLRVHSSELRTFPSIVDDSVDVPTRRARATLKGHSGVVMHVAYSPDGNTLVSSGQDGKVKLWDTTVTKERDKFPGHRVKFSLTGDLVSWNKDGVLKVWDTATGKQKKIFKPRGVVALSDDGKLMATGSDDGAVEIQDLQTGKEHKVSHAHHAKVEFLRFSPNGRTLASVAGRVFTLWDVTTSQPLPDLDVYRADHAPSAYVMAFSPSRQEMLATVTEDNTGKKEWVLRLWDLKGNQLATLDRSQKNGPILALAFSHDGTLLASGAWSGRIRVWNVKTGETMCDIKRHARSVYSLAFSPNGRRLACGSADGTVKLWDPRSGEEIITLNGAAQQFSVAFSRDGSMLASAGEDETVNIWRATTKAQVRRTIDHY